MRVLILGGDGYLGWPQALYFSARGHEVGIVDNFARRMYDLELGTESLAPISTLYERIRAWRAANSHRDIERTRNRRCAPIHADETNQADAFPGSRPSSALVGGSLVPFIGDLCDYEFTANALQGFGPDAIVHFAEQRSAPYSHIDAAHAAYTQRNNVIGTLNVLYAMREVCPKAHLIKLGTMGEYGTPNIDIEEGYIEIRHNGRSDTLPYPRRPGSWYHASKVHDSVNIDLACRIWGLRATDLHQGVVYGVETEETSSEFGRETRNLLATRFDYDHVFGTVLNRFCVEAAAGHPLTVYGEGGQTRGYIDIRDTMRCIELAALNPPKAGRLEVMNQITEQFSVNELAEMVRRAAKKEFGIEAEIEHLENPRVEAERHYYNVRHEKFRMMGLEGRRLAEAVGGLIGTAARWRERIRADAIRPGVRWR